MVNQSACMTEVWMVQTEFIVAEIARIRAFLFRAIPAPLF
jgi:hypothetical protein